MVAAKGMAGIGKPTRWRRFRRLARRMLGWTALAVLVLLLLAFLSLLTAPTRGLWLGVAIDKVGQSLPGSLQGDWTWPRLGRLEVRNLLWTTSGADTDTLLALDELAVDIDLGALRVRSLHLNEVLVRGTLVDVPGIMAIMPARADSNVQTTTKSEIPWFNEGSLPDLPSARIDAFSADLARLLLPDDRQVQSAHVAGSASVAAEHRPGLLVSSLSGRINSTMEPFWSADLAGLELAAFFDPATQTVAVDTLSARLNRFEARSDTLEISAGPLDLSASGSLAESRVRLAAGLDFKTAVPAALARPLPGMEFREAAGRLDLQIDGDTESAEVTMKLAVDPMAEIRDARLDAGFQVGLQPEPRLLAVHDADVAFFLMDTEITARGRWDGHALEGMARVHLPDLRVPRLFVPRLLEGVSGRGHVDASFAGAVDNPNITADIAVSGQAVSLWARPELAEVADRLPPDFPREDFDQVAMDLQGRLTGTLDDLAVRLRTDLGRTPALDRALISGNSRLNLVDRTLASLQIDTLAVGLKNVDLFVTGSMDTTAADLAFIANVAGPDVLQLWDTALAETTDLSLAARGEVRGPWRNLHVDAQAGGRVVTADLSVPEWALQVQGKRSALSARLQAGGGLGQGSMLLDSLTVDWTGRIEPDEVLPRGDFRLGVWAPQGRAWATGSAHKDADSTRSVTLASLGFEATDQRVETTEPVRIRLGPDARDLTLSPLRMAGDLGTLAVAGQTSATELAINAETDLRLPRDVLDALVPSPFWSAAGGLDLTLDGQVDLALAQGSAPRLAGRSNLALIPREETDPAQLALSFRSGDGDTTDLQADFQLSVGPQPLIQGAFVWPGIVDPASGSWRSAADIAGRLDIQEQDLPLDFINRFLPEEVSLDGQLSIGAGLEIAASDSLATKMRTGTVSGLLQAEALRVDLPNRSRVALDAQIALGGRLIDPRLEGTVTISDGFFRLPEIQRSLLPINGTSALWVAADADSLGLADTWKVDREPRPETSHYLPDLAVRVVIPGQFRVVGYGLESELAGDFVISRGWDEKGRPAPVLRGRVRIVDGTLVALNRVFDIEIGEFNLDGRIPTNPSVNLVFATEIDGTSIRIRVTGEALQPKIVLESEPEMSQADITAFLLFGRPVNDLDTEQRGNLRQEKTPAQQLRQNLQGLALVFGAAGVQDRVSGKVGIDQVQVGSDSAGGSTLVLGKFLNPRMLLKYHQSLERSGTYFLTLEYTLSKLFKLISTYGQGEEHSGLELRWQHRY